MVPFGVLEKARGGLTVGLGGAAESASKEALVSGLASLLEDPEKVCFVFVSFCLVFLPFLLDVFPSVIISFCLSHFF